ncbi:hypothetical protein [Leuconostoc mesenteroides]|uniref:hypothetical protein n=1 Tax=Leuconostoc mesenteroides TaxID=1245 RepID=UPI001CBF2089|nr:hypothetical protein [Leuconostoc mesenteroides]
MVQQRKNQSCQSKNKSCLISSALDKKHSELLTYEQIIASVVTFLFIIVQRTFRGLHLINQL